VFQWNIQSSDENVIQILLKFDLEKIAANCAALYSRCLTPDCIAFAIQNSNEEFLTSIIQSKQLSPKILNDEKVVKVVMLELAEGRKLNFIVNIISCLWFPGIPHVYVEQFIAVAD